jgi:Short C-terminal domain
MGLFTKRNPNMEIAKKVAANLGVGWDDVEYWAAFKTPASAAFHKSAVLITKDQIIYGTNRVALKGAHAVVDTSGNTALAQGWVVKERTDTRQLFLTIESDRSIVIQLLPGGEAVARQVAAYINSNAGPPLATAPSVSASSAPVDIPDQIRKLAVLRDEGILSVEEFETKKAELLRKL